MADSPALAAGPATGPQRRYLTMLFSDLTDSTRIAYSMETEDYAELLSHLRRFYLEVIPKHGGTLVQIQGDGLLAIFGYPETREENGRQATEAALDLHERVRELQKQVSLPGLPPLTLHTGVHSGLVLFETGDSVRGRFELLGNATNLASRLSDVGEADEILVSEETLGPEKNFFVTSERRSLLLKGRDAPMGVYRILGRATIANRYEARARRGLVPFVGRGTELEVLDRTLNEALTGQIRCAAITAAAGLGKTRLAEEFLDRAVRLGYQVHRGYCESYLSAEPLQPFLQVLRSHCGLTREMSAETAAAALDTALAALDSRLLASRKELLRALSIILPGSEGEAGRSAPEAMIAALRDVVDSLAAKKPALLFFDDWQWADDASRQVLNAIRDLAGRPLFILVATRQSRAEAALGDAVFLDLDPFSEDEAAATIARLLPSTSPFEIGEITRYSGGNPMIIEELCHSAAHEGPRRPGGVRGGVAWLHTLIESRVARLPPAQVELARTAAVIGYVIPVWLLERLTGCGERDPLIEGLEEHDFLFPAELPGTLRFKHGIARDVIYNSVGLRERKALHLRIADLLQQESSRGGNEEIYEALAYHFGAGGQAALAAKFGELAGEKAMTGSSFDRAQTQYRAALAALEALEPSDATYRGWMRVANRFGLACVFDPSRDHLVVFRRAVELAAAQSDQVALARAEYWLGYISYALGESRIAVAHCERALKAARRAGDERMVVQIHTTLGQAAAAAGQYDQALSLLDEALALKRTHAPLGRASVSSAYMLACKASALGDRGLFAQAHECIDLAIDSVRSAKHEIEASILCWRSAVCLWQGRWHDALEAANEAQRIAERVKGLYVFSMGRALGAYASWTMRPAPEALKNLADATAWLEARDRGLFISLNHGWLAECMFTSGLRTDARRHAARALQRARKDDRLGLAMACRALARSAAQGAERRPAEHYLAIATDSARARGSPHDIALTQLCHAEIELGRGNRAVAEPLIDNAEEAFRSMAMPWHVAEAQKLRRQA